MATPQEMNEIVSHLRQVPAMAESCRHVVTTLIKTGYSWTSGNFLISLLFPTDYDMTRSQIISVCDSQIQRLAVIRRETPNPNMIRAASYLTQIRRCCQRCRQLNINKIRLGKSFQCRVLNPLKNNGFRFMLNSKGEIIETG